ncbi:aminopeptidase [Anaerovoracaceae bacterium 42-11]|nr:aminopeptidase [Emergencia sp.]
MKDKEERKGSMELNYQRKNIWKNASAEKRNRIMETAVDFKAFNDASKTERLCVKEVVRRAEAAGFCDITKADSVKAGDKVYYNDGGKLLYVAVAGEKPLTEGANIVVAHTDCTRLDFKIVPLFEKDGFAYGKTCMYSLSKLEKWTSTPLSMYGTVVRKDGSIVEIAEGASEDQPALFITDMSLHYSVMQGQKKQEEAYNHEQMNVFLGATPAEGDVAEAVKENILQYLYEKYGIIEEDFISAEIEIVPAGKTRDIGLDSSALCGYGFDDRAAVYAQLCGILACEKPERSAIAIFVDKEEIGFAGRSGSHSRVTDYFLRLLAEKTGCGGEGIALNQIQLGSKVMSLEAVCGNDPNYPEVCEPYSGSLLGHGLQVIKYASRYGKMDTSEASAEYLGQVRKVFNDNGVIWQPFAGIEKFGGFGTVSVDYSNMGMESFDAAICVLGAHSPYEFMLKSDLYEACLACRVFFEKLQ